MKVILQQDVKGQGKKGQMIEASDGYARNFLLPRKLAVPATAENVNTMKMQEKAKKAQEAAEKAEAEATAAKLKELTVKVVAKGGNGGRLFGAVTSQGDRRRPPGPARHRHRLRPRSSRTSPSRPSAAMS